MIGPTWGGFGQQGAEGLGNERRRTDWATQERTIGPMWGRDWLTGMIW